MMGMKIMSRIKAMVLFDKKYDFNWREEIMCGIIAMLYIDKCHNYDLNWGVMNMSTVLCFFLTEKQNQPCKEFDNMFFSPTRQVPS